MGKWTSFKSSVKKTADISGKVSKVRGVAHNVGENGVVQTATDMVSAKARRAAAKRAMVMARTVFRFLITPIWGWVVSGVILLVLIGSSTFLSRASNDMNLVNGNVTQEQLAAMNGGCPVIPTSTGSVSGSVELGTGKNNWSYSDVATFATSSLKSTWGISDDAAANYFLTGNQRIATKYGLNKNNIGEITSAVKNAGVSPAFFYIYAVSEGGGFGGFINHYGSDTSGGGLANAKRDAEYLVQTGKAVGLKPATIVGNVPREEVLRGMPTGPAQELLAKMGDGTIGKVYIPSTAAVTAEIANLAGQTGPWSPPGSGYGAPLSELMTTITKLGGDIHNAEQIKIGGVQALSANCKPKAGGGLVEGGTIGKVYIPSTAAVTAEIANLAGQTGPWSPPGSGYGAPLSELMTTITRLGGDIHNAEQIKIGGVQALSANCKPKAGGGLVEGGMSFADARKFMLEKYKNIPITMSDIPGAAAGSPSIWDNCTAFVAFFINKYTSLKTGAGNGVDVVNNLVNVNGGKLTKSDKPTVYSVFSLPGGGGPGLALGAEGHTGVVLGIDTKKGVAIIGQASYGMDSWAAGFETMEIKLSQMTPENGWSFTDVSKYIKSGNGI